MKIFLFLLFPSLCFSQSFDQLRHALIKSEGYTLVSYRDSLGFQTIGIGHRLESNKRATLTHAQVDDLFRNDVNNAIRAARAEIPNYDKHSAKVKMVLIELSFQLGQTGLRKFKKFNEAMNKMNYVLAAQELRNSKVFKQTPNRIMRHIKVLTSQTNILIFTP